MQSQQYKLLSRLFFRTMYWYCADLQWVLTCLSLPPPSSFFFIIVNRASGSGLVSSRFVSTGHSASSGRPFDLTSPLPSLPLPPRGSR